MLYVSGYTFALSQLTITNIELGIYVLQVQVPTLYRHKNYQFEYQSSRNNNNIMSSEKPEAQAI